MERINPRAAINRQVKIDSTTKVKLSSLDPTSAVDFFKHPYFELYEKQFDIAKKEYALNPTMYFFEAMAYHERAEFLEHNYLNEKEGFSCSDDLQDNIPIYNTVHRWCAGFSNAPQQMFLGKENPKYKHNKKNKLPTEGYRGKFDTKLWMYLFLIHRITGSGASFSGVGDRLPPHGWYNTPLPFLCKNADPTFASIKNLILNYTQPMFTSVGNQIPPFNKPNAPYTTGGREYLVEIAPELVKRTHRLLSKSAHPGIQHVVDQVLDIQSDLGCKRFKFVLTAWVMDLAEYFPDLVDSNSDCYHGKNAVEAIELCFNLHNKKQESYDRATRFFADTFGTRPMDVEDAAPGCDIIRWVENYIKDGTYPNIDRKKVFNKCYVSHSSGRQRK